MTELLVEIHAVATIRANPISGYMQGRDFAFVSHFWCSLEKSNPP